jgi:hypothetical protein
MTSALARQLLLVRFATRGSRTRIARSTFFDGEDGRKERWLLLLYIAAALWIVLAAFLTGLTTTGIIRRLVL